MRKKHWIVAIVVIIIVYFLIKYLTSGDNDDEYRKNAYLTRNSIESGEHIPWNMYKNDLDNDVYKRFYEIKHNYDTDGQKRVSIDDKRMLENRRINDINKPFYTILEYTRVFGQTKFCQLRLNEKTLDYYKSNDKFKQIFANNEVHKSLKLGSYTQLDSCKYNNCFFTCDKTYLQNVDALIFHYQDLGNDIQSLQQQYEYLLEQRHRPHVYVLWHDEAHPILSKYDYIKFNWTMSYYTTADVSYGTYGVLEKHRLKLNEIQSFKKNLFENLRQQFDKRDTSALWFVSNCKEKRRIQVAIELSKYIEITINGACNSEFEKILSNVANKLIKFLKDDKCTRDSKCEMDAFNKHKFYLAFETSNCSDYITEKFWKALSNGLIPVVIQPSKESYERLAPNNSYIHAQDFDYDYKQLAEHMMRISKDYDLYSKYFEWKLDYDVLYKINDIEKYRMCELCTKLNTETSYIYYNSLSKWSSNQCGQSGK